MNNTYLIDLAFLAVVSDGEIDENEILCLKTIFIEFDFDNEVLENRLRILINKWDAIKNFNQFKIDIYREIEDINNFKEVKFLVSVLIQLIEADGFVHQNELLYLHEIIEKLNINKEELIQEFPLWREVLTLTPSVQSLHAKNINALKDFRI